MPVELTDKERRALFARLDVAESSPSLAYLAQLQRAWLWAQPFHNLELLSGSSPVDEGGAVTRCVEGFGGPCHVQAAGFLALLRAVGFDASFVAASIGHPNDHLLICVRVEGERRWCDVGNGQPYLIPFPEDRPLEQHHVGWWMRSSPIISGVLLERSSPDQPQLRRVYEASREQKNWADFEDIIRRHHREEGFGPFLMGLRAVRMGPKQMTTLRDNRLTRFKDGHFEQRVLSSLEEVKDALHDTLCLSMLPIDEALQQWIVRGGRV
jgi:arylamine N-acetyltransferase